MSSRTRIAALTLMLGISGGCGSSTPASNSNPDQARVILKDTLESWKRGDKPDAATKLNPPVIVVDEDWTAGKKLIDYRIEPGDQLAGTALRASVTLTLPDKAGKPKPVVASYLVTTEPILRVDRQDAP